MTVNQDMPHPEDTTEGGAAPPEVGRRKGKPRFPLRGLTRPVQRPAEASDAQTRERATPWPGVIARYRTFLPVSAATPVVTLLEGNTPLIESPRLSRLIGRGARVYLKFEGMNPTGSFKDRGMTVAVSKACEAKATAVICASTGNTSASASAYAARAGLRSFVLLPKGAIALGKLSQALIHGARVLAIEGSFDECLALVRQVAEARPVTVVNSINQYRIEGQKTGAFEICDHLGRAPDYHLTPVGNAGNITAYWRGYTEYQAQGLTTGRPRMVGFQAAGAAPIVKGRVIRRPTTVATAIRIGNPASWRQAEQARDESGGTIETVTDAQILTAYRALACQEGLFVEPASAASVAGLMKLAARGYFTGPQPMIVCVLTGHGLKDPEGAMQRITPPRAVPPTLARVLAAIDRS